MGNDEAALTESGGITSGDLIRSGLEDKVRAITGYEEIIWKIRSGYIVLLYGALTFVLGKEPIPDICAVTGNVSQAVAISL